MKKLSKHIMFFALVGLILTSFHSKIASAEGNTQPRVVITAYEAEAGGLVPGEPTNVTFTLKNMSKDFSVYSVLLTCTSSNDQMFANYGNSNQAYVEEIGPQGQATVSLTLTAPESLDAESVNGNVKVEYIDNINGNSSSNTSITFPIRKDSLNIMRVNIPQSAEVGEKTRISVTFENDTTADAYNGLMVVKGSGMEDTTVDLGTVLKKSSKSQEVYVTLNELGEQSLVLEVSYQDDQGMEVTNTTEEYLINVVEKEEQSIVSDQTTDATASVVVNSQAGKKMGYLLGFGICGIVILITIFRKRNQ